MGNREDEDLDRLVKPKKSLKGYGSKAREAEEKERKSATNTCCSKLLTQVS